MIQDGLDAQRLHIDSTSTHSVDAPDAQIVWDPALEDAPSGGVFLMPRRRFMAGLEFHDRLHSTPKATII